MCLRKQAALETSRNLPHQVSSVTFHLLSLFSKVPTDTLKQIVMFKRDYFERMVTKQGHSKEKPNTPELAAREHPPSVCRAGVGARGEDLGARGGVVRGVGGREKEYQKQVQHLPPGQEASPGTKWQAV